MALFLVVKKSLHFIDQQVATMLWTVEVGEVCRPSVLQVAKRPHFVTFHMAMSHIRDMDAYDPTMIGEEIGAQLHATRLAVGITQQQLATAAGITRQKLIQVEQGRPQWLRTPPSWGRSDCNPC
jgi:DNA-binding XRE family transcriptional regulator